jgi:hypothetical protein
MPGPADMTAAEFLTHQQHGTLQHYLRAKDDAEVCPEAALLAHINTCTSRSGWSGWWTREARGKGSGVEGLLIRGTDVLYVQLLGPQTRPTMVQQTWVSLLTHTGKFEVHQWRPQDRQAITDRLCCPQR